MVNFFVFRIVPMQHNAPLCCILYSISDIFQKTLYLKGKNIAKEEIILNTAQPIRNTEDLERFKNYYLCEEKHPRNQFLIVLGLNTALRITDILSLRWADVYDFKKDCCLSHIMTTERKTKKQSMVYMNQSITSYLVVYREIHKEAAPESFLFEGNDEGHLSRSQAWRIVRHAAQSCGIQGVISPHSLRKTFGFFA